MKKLCNPTSRITSLQVVVLGEALVPEVEQASSEVPRVLNPQQSMGLEMVQLPSSCLFWSLLVTEVPPYSTPLNLFTLSHQLV